MRGLFSPSFLVFCFIETWQNHLGQVSWQLDWFSLASLVPYFQEYLTNEAISGESDRYIGYGAVHVYPVLKAVLYWLRYGSALFSNRIITDVSFDWITTVSWLQMVVQYAWQAALYLVGAATVVVSAKLNWTTWKAIKPALKRGVAIENDTQWLQLFAGAAVLGIIISAMLSPITFSYWHLIITYPLALIPLLILSEQWVKDKPQQLTRFLFIGACFFTVVNLVAAHDSNKFSYKVDYVEQVELYLQQQGLTPRSP